MAKYKCIKPCPVNSDPLDQTLIPLGTIVWGYETPSPLSYTVIMYSHYELWLPDTVWVNYFELTDKYLEESKGEVKMTKEEKIKELENQIEKLKRESENPNTPELNDRYYYTSSNGKNFLSKFDGIEDDNGTINISDCYRTREEQKDYTEYREAIMRLKSWIRKHNDGWKPDFGDKRTKYYLFLMDNNLYSNDTDNIQSEPLWFYFKDLYTAEQCIGEMRDDLMTYFTYNNFDWLEVPKEEEE